MGKKVAYAVLVCDEFPIYFSLGPLELFYVKIEVCVCLRDELP
jgi:hypothetical protein